jgi:hypothetical protein
MRGVQPALQRMADKAEGQGKRVLAVSLMEQAEKEVGDSYTNRRELTGKGGNPMKVQSLADFYSDLKPGAS